MLYRENVLEINVGAIDVEMEESVPSIRTVREFCAAVFTYDRDDWSTKVPRSLRSSVFSAFLNAIGKTNTGSITAISLYSEGPDNITHSLPVITELVARYLPDLRRLGIHSAGKNMDPLERLSWDWYHPDPDSPFHTFWHNGGFWPLYDGLQTFVDRVTWLREFEYEGQICLEACDDSFDEGSYQTLKSLEVMVKTRAEGMDGSEEAARFLSTAEEKFLQEGGYFQGRVRGRGGYPWGRGRGRGRGFGPSVGRS